MPRALKSNLASLSAFQSIWKEFQFHKVEFRNKWKDKWKQKISYYSGTLLYTIQNNFSPITKSLSQVFSPKPSI